MQKIHPLTPEMISRIAAGEVIERPAYAVKELIENALDAQPSRIVVDIEQSGLKKISVLDDGEGMSYADLAECFKPHTTSKIGPEDHLIGIKTMGFRGEALSSIASVSNMTIQSRNGDENSGHEIRINNGRPEKFVPVGMPVGTKVIVEDLFASVPARRKFLKSNQSEWRLILDIVSNLAMANPNIRFSLSHNKKIVFDLDQNQTLAQRARILLGDTLFKDLLPFQFEESFIKIEGFLGRPHIAMSQQNKQYIFVNLRRVNDRLVSLAVKEAFGTLLPNLYFPVFLLSIKLPYEMIDVNIHPRKEQISFLPSEQVFELVRKSVFETLLKNNLTYTPGETPVSATSFYTGSRLKAEIETWNVFSDEFDEEAEYLQLNNLYLITVSKRGLYIYDQHACHERILYEQFQEGFKKNKLFTAAPKNSLSLELGPQESELLKEYLPLYKKSGFEFEEFTPGVFKVLKVPVEFLDRNIIELIKESLEQLADSGSFSRVDYLSDEIIKFLACKSAIKAGDKLNSRQAGRLIQKLNKTANKATCPHGRPTVIFYPHNDLDRQFRR